jgi:hypothetical protein
MVWRNIFTVVGSVNLASQKVNPIKAYVPATFGGTACAACASANNATPAQMLIRIFMMFPWLDRRFPIAGLAEPR